MLSGDTIIAPLTAPGRGAVGIVRISGQNVKEILKALLGHVTNARVMDSPRSLVYGKILNPHVTTQSSNVIDCGLIAFFPEPNSFTGEDIAEFHLHGSPYLIEQLIKTCCALGARLARPGEFSERAFLNGRIDLTQAEAIADLIASESEAQARVAREQLDGKLANAVSSLGDPLRFLLAEIEAYIDFPEEGIDVVERGKWSRELEQSIECLKQLIDSFDSGRLYREGARVVICGLPNAGKSSLLNRLLGEDRVIVSHIPGTTRDAIEESITINGLLVRICDTAGITGKSDLQHHPDTLELLGVEFSKKRLLSADILLAVYDPTEPHERQMELMEYAISLNKKMLLVVNKHDVSPSTALRLYETGKLKEFENISVSALTGTGIEDLKLAIYRLACPNSRSHSSVLVSNVRHFQLLQKAKENVVSALSGIISNVPPEIIAFELRSSLNHLSEIIGITTTEDILGLIFSRFCIGK